MTITAQRLLTELGLRKWSGYSVDDLVFGQDEALQAQTELNVSLRYLINLDDFPFKTATKEIYTNTNEELYSMVDGQIDNIYLDRTPLEYIDDPTGLDKTLTGRPTGYWINYNNPKAKIQLYPIPDKNYTLELIYDQFYPVIDQNGKTKKFEFENKNDFMNLPAHLEFLFMDCLILRCMAVSNKDEQDENYRPTLQEFQETWRIFKRACKPKKVEARVVI
jgi:hypothetical protein